MKRNIQCRIPVIAAGGIYERKDVEKMEHLGADGVQVATRFITTRECDADERYKEAYIRAKKGRHRDCEKSGGNAGKSGSESFDAAGYEGRRFLTAPVTDVLQGVSLQKSLTVSQTA